MGLKEILISMGFYGIKELRREKEKVVLREDTFEELNQRALKETLTIRPKLDPASLQWFSEEQAIKLDKATTNKLIWNRGGRDLCITGFNGDPQNTKIRLNNIAGPIYEIKPGYLKGPFKRIYLTNTAQVGKTLKFVVSYRNFAEFRLGNGILIATTPHIYRVVMAAINTEYSQELPGGTKRIKACLDDASEFRYAYEAGQVANVVNNSFIQPASNPYEDEGLYLSGKTFYFATGTADGKYMRILAWT